MAGVEQATPPGAAAPDETPEAATTPESHPADRPVAGQSAGPDAEPTTRAGRRAARRRSSQKAGRQSDAPEAGEPAQHSTPSGDDARPTRHYAAEPRTTTGTDLDDAESAGQHATDPRTTTGTEQAATQRAGADAKPSAKPSAKPAAKPSAKPSDQPAATGTHATGTHATGTHAIAGDRDPGPVSAVSLVKSRPAHTRADNPAETPAETPEPTREPATGSTSNGSRSPRPSGPAHAGAPHYRPRHAKRNRRRWPVLLTAGLVLVALAGVGAAALVNRQDDGTDGATAPAATHIAPAPANLPTGPSTAASAPPAAAAPAAPGSTVCGFNPAPDKTPNIVPPDVATRTGLVTATIGTNRGPISLELDATNAPCTVESFLTLAAGGFFNDTACHRLTTMLIFVLQCGDPTGLGSGDPGYSFDDENLPAPGGTPYPRGTLAMANAGPDTNGSQFFIVYKDSPIDPNYPVFGRVTGGLEIVDQVAAGGAPGNDGQPNESLVIQAVQLA